jgi:hypothetical protein
MSAKDRCDNCDGIGLCKNCPVFRKLREITRAVNHSQEQKR